MTFTELINVMPAWASTPEAQAWFVGFAIGSVVRMTRAAISYVRSIGKEL